MLVFVNTCDVGCYENLNLAQLGWEIWTSRIHKEFEGKESAFLSKWLWIDWHITLTCYIFKVYTINLESKYVLVQGIPAVGAKKELLELFALYGAIDE